MIRIRKDADRGHFDFGWLNTYHSFSFGEYRWVQVARGAAGVNGQALEAGDGAALSNEELVRLSSTGGAEILLFDLP